MKDAYAARWRHLNVQYIANHLPVCLREIQHTFFRPEEGQLLRNKFDSDVLELAGKRFSCSYAKIMFGILCVLEYAAKTEMVSRVHTFFLSKFVGPKGRVKMTRGPANVYYSICLHV